MADDYYAPQDDPPDPAVETPTPPADELMVRRFDVVRWFVENVGDYEDSEDRAYVSMPLGKLRALAAELSARPAVEERGERERLRKMVGWLEERLPEFKGSDAAAYMLADIDALVARLSSRPATASEPTDAERTAAIRALAASDRRITYAQIGERFGLSRQRIQQIVNGRPERAALRSPVASHTETTEEINPNDLPSPP
jgi:hypothetical protein